MACHYSTQHSRYQEGYLRQNQCQFQQYPQIHQYHHQYQHTYQYPHHQHQYQHDQWHVQHLTNAISSLRAPFASFSSDLNGSMRRLLRPFASYTTAALPALSPTSPYPFPPPLQSAAYPSHEQATASMAHPPLSPAANVTTKVHHSINPPQKQQSIAQDHVFSDLSVHDMEIHMPVHPELLHHHQSQPSAEISQLDLRHCQSSAEHTEEEEQAEPEKPKDPEEEKLGARSLVVQGPTSSGKTKQPSEKDEEMLFIDRNDSHDLSFDSKAKVLIRQNEKEEEDEFQRKCQHQEQLSGQEGEIEEKKEEKSSLPSTQSDEQAFQYNTGTLLHSFGLNLNESFLRQGILKPDKSNKEVQESVESSSFEQDLLRLANMTIT